MLLSALAVCGINPGFPGLSPTKGYVTYVLLTRSPVPRRVPRLACVKPAASVRSEPGSNSPVWFLTSSQLASFTCVFSLLSVSDLGLVNRALAELTWLLPDFQRPARWEKRASCWKCFWLPSAPPALIGHSHRVQPSIRVYFLGLAKLRPMLSGLDGPPVFRLSARPAQLPVRRFGCN